MMWPVRWEKAGQKRARAAAAEPRETAPGVHVPNVYTNGSFAPEAPGVGFAGFGVWFGPRDPRNISRHLDGIEQTNNRAELSAVIAVLRVVPVMQPLITDSRYVYDGATVHLHWWFTVGRQVSNLDLWQQWREAMLSRTTHTAFKHVYSHVGIVGNERADDPANLGRLGHPGRLHFLLNRGVRQSAPLVVLRP